MGDRCHLTITLLKKDISTFEAILGNHWCHEIQGETERYLTVFIEDANYSLYEPRQQLAKQRICFLGNHGPGYEYAAMLFASVGGHYAEIETIDGQPVVPIGKNGQVRPRELREARRYCRIDLHARKYLYRGKD